MNRFYIIILTTFIVFVLIVNIITRINSVDGYNVYNVFSFKERFIAVSYLLEHIVLESGIVVRSTPKEKIITDIEKYSQEFQVDPLLIETMVEHGSKWREFTISTNGNMGLMLINADIINKFPGVDPFIAENNLKMGIKQISELVQNYGYDKKMLEKYYYPTATTLFKLNTDIANKTSEKVWNDYINKTVQ